MGEIFEREGDRRELDMGEEMSEWREYKLGQLVDQGIADLQTGPFGTMLSASEYTAMGIPVIAVQDIGENKLKHNKFVYVDESTVSRLSRYKVKEGDIIFGRKGAVERRAIIKKNEEGWLQGSDCIRVRFNSSIDSTFISYQFGSQSYKEWMLQNSTGATMPSLNQQVLKLLPITLPPLPEQKAIASILSSLDDKIDLLHRQNRTLEAIAETLFRQCFIEEAQENWENRKLDDVISVKGGTTPSTKEPKYWDGDINWTSPRDLSNHNFVFLTNTERKITEKGLSQIGSGLLPLGTVLLSSRAPIGYLAITDIPVAINQGYIAIICDKLVSNYFIYLWCKANMEDIENAGNGSVFQEISKTNFKTLGIQIPSIEIFSRFEKSVSSIFEKLRSNQKQICVLEKLRDNLLPKLMSGEVRVSY
jgi:type I restriction enzyme, S subunit